MSFYSEVLVVTDRELLGETQSTNTMTRINETLSRAAWVDVMYVQAIRHSVEIATCAGQRRSRGPHISFTRIP